MEERRLINDALLTLERLRPSRLSLYETIRIFGRKKSKHFILRSTPYTKQVFSEGIATKVYQQFEGQSKAFRRWMFRHARLWDRKDFTALREILEAEGGTWAGLRRVIRGDYLPMGVTPQTASALACAEPVRIRPINSPLAFLRSRTFRFVKTQRRNYGVVIVHPWLPRTHIFLRVVGRGHDAYIEELLHREGQARGTATAELRVENDRLLLCVLFVREVPSSDYRPRTYIGVDLGYVNVAVAAAVDPVARRLIRPSFWSGRSVRHRLRILNGRDAAHRSRGSDPVATANHRRYWTHRVASEVVAFARSFPDAVLVLEDLRGIRRGRKSWGPRGNDEFHRWDYARMRKFIEHAAAWHGIRVISVPPRGTSSACPRCSGVVSRVRRRHVTKCLNRGCGYENNDDLIGAFNLALKGVKAVELANAEAPRGPAESGVQSMDSPFISTLVHPTVESLSSAGSEGTSPALKESKAVIRDGARLGSIPGSRGLLAARPDPLRAVRLTRQAGPGWTVTRTEQLDYCPSRPPFENSAYLRRPHLGRSLSFTRNMPGRTSGRTASPAGPCPPPAYRRAASGRGCPPRASPSSPRPTSPLPSLPWLALEGTGHHPGIERDTSFRPDNFRR